MQKASRPNIFKYFQIFTFVTKPIVITNARRIRFIFRPWSILHPRNIITVTNPIVITNARRKAIYKLINGKFTIFRLWNLTEFTGVIIRWYFMDEISWTCHLWVCKSPFLLFIQIPKAGGIVVEEIVQLRRCVYYEGNLVFTQSILLACEYTILVKEAVW